MNRLINISPFIVMDIMKKACRYSNTVHMEVGEPDLRPPPGVTEALEKAVAEKKFYYTPALGLYDLRERISIYYSERYGLDVSPERIIVTPGSSGAFLLILAILLERGEKFYLTDPSYPCYKNFGHFLDIFPIFIPVDQISSFNIDIDNIKADKEAKAFIISSPVNPYGKVYGRKDMEGLFDFCCKRRLTLISDEVYQGFIYEKEDVTALEISDDAIVVNGFSKSFCMPGLRVGWVVLPNRLIRQAEIIMQNIFIATNTLGQYAACMAFDYSYLDKVKDTFRQRRDFIYSELKDIFNIEPYPDGAFYLWADISRYMSDGLSFSELLLEREHVAVTPGIDFGNHNTRQFIRLAYTRDIEELKEAVERIKRFISSLGTVQK